MTGKQRMLNAYRGLVSDRIAVAPEFWYYYPAQILGVDMIEFEREVPFHSALKTSFARFGCEGWGVAYAAPPPGDWDIETRETWSDAGQLEVRQTIRTPAGDISGVQVFDREEPSWHTERPIKDFIIDLPAYVCATIGGRVEDIDLSGMIAAHAEVGEAYLLEANLGQPFFDYFAGGREGGLETAVFDFIEHENELRALQEQYLDFIRRKTELICTKTDIESLFIGCSWSCNSLIGPNMWREWDKPVIQAAVETAHRHGRLVHIHFHGRCLDTVADFAEIGIDCVCPFERPPGGDIAGAGGLRQVARLLNGRTTMNGNVHTVETLIRGTPADVRREVQEICSAFAGNPRVILGTGDQVGRETPEENIQAMIDAAGEFQNT